MTIVFQRHAFETIEDISSDVMGSAELLALYNKVAVYMERPTVKRFADRKSGNKRTWALLLEYAASRQQQAAVPLKEETAPLDVLHEDPEYTDEHNAIMASAAANPVVLLGAPEPKAARKTRSMVFRFQPQDPSTGKRKAGTLRAQCEALMIDASKDGGEGVTIEDIMKLCQEFDEARGKASVHLKRRAYELVRLMHYALGHGLDDRGGKIRIVTKQTRLPGA